MPDRIIRDEILNSDNVLGLKRNTHRLAFVACVLEADDLGNFEAGPGALWRLWRDWLALTDRAQVAEIMVGLTDSGLVRLYEVAGKRYAHIPKFRQRLRYVNGKHPRPPETIECNEISKLLEKSPTKVSLKTDHSRTVVDRSEVKRSEEKRREVSAPVDNSPTPEPPLPVFIEKKNGNGKTPPWNTTLSGIEAKAHELGVHTQGLSRDEAVKKISVALAAKLQVKT